MNKHLIITIIGILLLSGIGANATSIHPENTINKTYIHQTFTQPIFIENNEFTTLTLPETNAWTHTPGNPFLPAYRTTITLPFGTKIHQ